MVLEAEIREWRRFSDFLRADERQLFEDMMDMLDRSMLPVLGKLSPTFTVNCVSSILIRAISERIYIQSRKTHSNSRP